MPINAHTPHSDVGLIGNIGNIIRNIKIIIGNKIKGNKRDIKRDIKII